MFSSSRMWMPLDSEDGRFDWNY